MVFRVPPVIELCILENFFSSPGGGLYCSISSVMIDTRLNFLSPIISYSSLINLVRDTSCLSPSEFVVSMILVFRLLWCELESLDLSSSPCTRFSLP